MNIQLDFGLGEDPKEFGPVAAVIVDGIRFAPVYLLALARSGGELFCAERVGEHVHIHTIAADIGSGYGRLVVQRRTPAAQEV